MIQTLRIALAAACLLATVPAGAQRYVANREAPRQRYRAEVVAGTLYVHLRADSGYLSIENGPLAIGPIDPGWWSSMWEVEPVDGTYFRLKNRWKGTYLTTRSGTVSVGDIQPDWRGAMWSMEDGGPMLAPRLTPSVADYRVLISSTPGVTARSSIYLTLHGPDGRTSEILLGASFESGARREVMVRAEPNVGTIARITLRNAGPDDWRAAELVIENQATGTTLTRRLDRRLRAGEAMDF